VEISQWKCVLCHEQKREALVLSLRQSNGAPDISPSGRVFLSLFAVYGNDRAHLHKLGAKTADWDFRRTEGRKGAKDNWKLYEKLISGFLTSNPFWQPSPPTPFCLLLSKWLRTTKKERKEKEMKFSTAELSFKCHQVLSNPISWMRLFSHEEKITDGKFRQKSIYDVINWQTRALLINSNAYGWLCE
jgi:hypothetical protein